MTSLFAAIVELGEDAPTHSVSLSLAVTVPDDEVPDGYWAAVEATLRRLRVVSEDDGSDPEVPW